MIRIKHRLAAFCLAALALPAAAQAPWVSVEYPQDASWLHFTALLFTNPASGSVGQDIIVTNAILFPLWTIIDGARRGLRLTWIYFVMSLFTSFGFAMGLYLAAQERQVRFSAAGSDDVGGRP